MSMQKGKRIGALWVRKSKDGKRYISGIIETMYGDLQVAAFLNDKKEKENHPDYHLVSNGLKLDVAESGRSGSGRDPLDPLGEDMGDGIPENEIEVGGLEGDDLDVIL